MIMAGCGGFSLDTTGNGCASLLSHSTRHYGSAGIIGSANDQLDPAISWGPTAISFSSEDLLIIHQDRMSFGRSGENMSLLYWLR